MVLDYSKWKQIEVSDDEDDTHPNVDTASLFRWRHQARVERMEKARQAREEVQRGKLELAVAINDIEDKLRAAHSTSEQDGEEGGRRQAELRAQREELRKREAEWAAKERELAEQEAKQPWNVDTVGNEAWSKSLINKSSASTCLTTATAQQRAMSDESDSSPKSSIGGGHGEKTEQALHFFDAKRALIERVLAVRGTDELERLLDEHPELSHDFTSTYVTMQALQAAIDEHWSELERLAHTSVYLQYLYEFAKGTAKLTAGGGTDRDTIQLFVKGFHRNAELREAYKLEVAGLVERLRQRALEKVAETEAEEKNDRIAQSPGGLDPMEVFDSLPQEMKEAFASRDKSTLEALAERMDDSLFSHHIQRCIDSGLWVPGPAGDDRNEGEEGSRKQRGDEQQEPLEGDETADDKPQRLDNKGEGV